MVNIRKAKVSFAPLDPHSPDLGSDPHAKLQLVVPTRELYEQVLLLPLYVLGASTIRRGGFQQGDCWIRTCEDVRSTTYHRFANFLGKRTLQRMTTDMGTSHRSRLRGVIADLGSPTS